MKKLLTIAFAAAIISMLYSCQRYPYISYYIKVVDQNGNNKLDTVSRPGKINVNDLWFEVIAGEFRDTLGITPYDEDYTAAADSTVAGNGVTPPENYQFPYIIKFCNFDRPHLWVSTSAPIGIELAQCPVFVIHWTDGSTDSLQIDNGMGTLSDPDYYVNGKKVKSEEEFITIVK